MGMADAFLFCRRCGEFFPLDISGPSTLTQDTDGQDIDLEAFKSDHEGHVLERATRVPAPSLADLPPWDPMTTTWFQVAIAGETLAVRGWRSSIDQPRKYQVDTAPPPVGPCLVEVDERLLQRALDQYFFPHALRPAKLERFLSAVRDLIQPLDADTVETCFDDLQFPNASIGPFPAQLCQLLLSRCTSIFDQWEMEHLQAFVQAHRAEYGALALRVRRRLSTEAA